MTRRIVLAALTVAMLGAVPSAASAADSGNSTAAKTCVEGTSAPRGACVSDAARNMHASTQTISSITFICDDPSYFGRPDSMIVSYAGFTDDPTSSTLFVTVTGSGTFALMNGTGSVLLQGFSQTGTVTLAQGRASVSQAYVSPC